MASADTPAAASGEVAWFERAAAEHVASLRPENTIRAYAADFACWRRFCAEFALDPQHCTSGLLVGFVAWLNTHGADVAHHDGSPHHRRGHDPARPRQRTLPRHRAGGPGRRGRGQAPALGVDQLRTIITAQPDTLAGVRDRALVLLGFALAARRSELAGLHVDDLVEHDQGLLVTIPVSKTGPAELPIAWGGLPGHLPRAGLAQARRRPRPAFHG